MKLTHRTLTCLSSIIGMLISSVPAWAETVTFRGETFTVWPREDLIRRGFNIPDVPREQNAAWVYIEAINKYTELPPELLQAFDYAVGKQWPTGQAKLTEYVTSETNREAIALVRKASQMDQCVMPCFGNPNESVVGMLLPNLSAYRALAKLIVVDGRRLEANGKYAEALDRYMTAVRMGEHSAQGVTLIEGLVGIAVWSLGNNAITELSLRHDHSAAALTDIANTLEQRTSRVPTVERGLEGESAIGPGVVDEICSRPFKTNFIVPALSGNPGSLGSSSSPLAPDGWSRLEKRVGQLLYPDRLVKKHMTDFYDAIKRQVKSGPRDRADRSFNEEKYMNEVIPRWDVLSRSLLPALSRATTMSLRVKADATLTRGAVALRRYAAEHEGKWPDKLMDAVPPEKAESFVDPFTGEQLGFRRTSTGWVLYSMGPNLNDDGGKKGDRWDQLDMVIEFPPTEIEAFQAEPNAEGN